jgi:hypothetical protein
MDEEPPQAPLLKEKRGGYRGYLKNPTQKKSKCPKPKRTHHSEEHFFMLKVIRYYRDNSGFHTWK